MLKVQSSLYIYPQEKMAKSSHFLLILAKLLTKHSNYAIIYLDPSKSYMFNPTCSDGACPLLTTLLG